MSRRKSHHRAAEIAAELTKTAIEAKVFSVKREADPEYHTAQSYYREMFQVVLECLGDEEERDEDDR